MEIFVKSGGQVEKCRQTVCGGSWTTVSRMSNKRPLEAAQQLCGAKDSIMCVELSPRQRGFGVVPSNDVAKVLDEQRSTAEVMSFYEVLQVHQPVRLYLDVDAQNELQYDNTLPTILSEHLQMVWPLVSNAGEIKVRCEVASCHRKNKWSFHVVAHIEVGSVAVVFSNNLCLLPFIRLMKRECENNAFVQAIDEAVYTRNRLMRTCYSAKQSASEHPFVPMPGSSRNLTDHLIVSAHVYDEKRTLVLSSDDCAEGVLPLITPRPGMASRGFGFDDQKIVLPPHAQTVVRLLSETVQVGSITGWVARGGVGGILSFSSVDRVFPCSLFCQPRPHKGNNLRFIFKFAYNTHDVLLQFCHDSHARYPSKQLAERAIQSEKISRNSILDFPPAWGGDCRAIVQVEIPQNVQNFCSQLRQPLQLTQFSVW